MFIGAKCGITAPKTATFSNFGHKFVPQGRLVCTVFTKLSAFVRDYRQFLSLFAFGGQTTKL